MIVMDTHIWVWWIHNDDRLTARVREHIKAKEMKDLV
jgi:PIN domain nuclease of toxin-antitoxin system